MRILIVTSYYDPHIIGGAEVCAQNLARTFSARGHDVAVLAAAPSQAEECWDAPFENYRIYRIGSAHIRSVFDIRSAPAWQKPIWHAQDVLDPRNEARIDRVVRDFRPDFIHVHWISGLGYNGLNAFGRHDVPVAITLHDLALPCLRTTMFRGDHECVSQCTDCKLSMAAKLRYIRHIPRLGFISPSRANLAKVGAFLPIDPYPRFHILNPTTYPAPSHPHTTSDRTRLLFVGRLENTKGIAFLLEALEPLAERFDFTLKVLGKGPDEAALRARFGHHPWLEIAGHVPLQQVADDMAGSDLLLVPSLWMENSPGVVIQALGVGLPVFASDKGGLPELVEPGRNGFIAPAGDTARWREQLAAILTAPEQLAGLRAQAEASAGAFDNEALADRMLEAFDVIADQPTKAAL